LPVPLGGTSNHFPRAVLDAVGGWDPYNVTEDADLGIRLARGGWHVGVLASTTWEEAPPTFRVWQGQRTRWLKGWMQTYLVHMRRRCGANSGRGVFSASKR
jgi:glycosyltransferase XagB